MSLPLSSPTSPADYPPTEWPLITRVTHPYLYRPVTVDRTPTAKSERYLARGGDGWLYLKQPIFADLLNLVPGDTDSAASFVEKVGIHEFLLWLMDPPKGEGGLPDAWQPIIGLQTIPYRLLEAAWTDPETRDRFFTARQELALAYQAAADAAPDVAAATDLVLELAEDLSTIRLEHRFDPESRRLIEKPADIFSRAWTELLDMLGRGHLPRLCPHCGRLFESKRTDKKYCSTECQQHAYDRRINRTPERKAYKRDHQQLTRKAEQARRQKAAQAPRKTL